MKNLTRWLAAALLTGSVLAFAVRAAESPSVLLQKGIYAEETEGDLDSAIKIYEQIATDSTANRAVAAQAHYRLALCHEKKGNKEQAISLLKELLRQSPLETALSEQAQQRLTELGKAPADDATARKFPLVLSGAVVAISPDGRFFASRSRSFDIVVADVATGKTSTLPRGADEEYIYGGLSFSPDSRRIAYDMAGRTIRISNSDGSETKDVYVEKGSAQGELNVVGWTPDAGRLIVVRRFSRKVASAYVLGEVELKTGSWKEIKNIPADAADSTFLGEEGRNLVMDVEAGADCTDPGAFEPKVGTGSWTRTGSMVLGRYFPAVAQLPSGKVLVAGGGLSSLGSRGYMNQVEIYDPATGAWTAAAPMPHPHRQFAAVLANGDVLAVGEDDPRHPGPTAYRFSEATATWSSAGTPSIVRFATISVALANGKVLLAGGYVGSGGGGAKSTYASAEIFDPTTNLWSPVEPMADSRSWHSGTRLQDGKVLVAGGSQRDAPTLTRASAELFNPASGTWAPAAAMHHARSTHTATLLPSGKVLVTGGYSIDSSTCQSTAEVYDPVSNRWEQVGSMACARVNHTAVLLASGKVLVAGGNNAVGSLASVEIFDPASNTWNSAPPMSTRRTWHAMEALPGGNVLVAGGQTANSIDTATAEIYRVDVAVGSQSPASAATPARP